MLSAYNSQQFMESVITKLYKNTDETKAACRPLFLLIVITKAIAFTLRNTLQN